MWLYIGFCVALFYAVKTQTNTANNGGKESEAIFADVIKNISRVNNVLQELITNYELLQKIYKSQENLDSKYSDSDIDEAFNIKNKKSRSQTTRSTLKEKFAATEMYWSDHEEGKKDKKEKSGDKTRGNIGAIKNKDVTKPKQMPRISKTENPETSSSSEFSGSEENEENVLKDQLKELITNKAPGNKKKSKSDKAQKKFFEKAVIEPNLELIVDKLLDADVKKTRYQKINKEKEAKSKQRLKPIPHRIELQDIAKKARKVKKIESSEIYVAHNTRKVSKALPTKKTLYDLLKDKTIEFEAKNELFMEGVKNVNKPNENSEDYNKKTGKDEAKHDNKRREIYKEAKSNNNHHQKEYHKIVKTNATSHDSLRNRDNEPKSNGTRHKNTVKNHKKSDNNHKKKDVEPKKSYNDQKTIDKNEESRGTSPKNKKKKLITKETQEISSDESMFHEKNKTSVLREAYGEACLKVVIRKCYKACGEASKGVCKETKCKSSLKDLFKTHSKTGCLNEFDANNGDSEKTTSLAPKTTDGDQGKANVVINKKSFVKEDDDDDDDDDLFTFRKAFRETYKDPTSEGFQVCLPTLSEHHGTIEKATNASIPRRLLQPPKEPKVPKLSFNILRDRFETACKKISCKKCQTACNYAAENTCATYNCSKRMTKLYNKNCKNSCRKSYKLKAIDSDSSESDSSYSDESTSSS